MNRWDYKALISVTESFKLKNNVIVEKVQTFLMRPCQLIFSG